MPADQVLNVSSILIGVAVAGHCGASVRRRPVHRSVQEVRRDEDRDALAPGQRNRSRAAIHVSRPVDQQLWPRPSPGSNWEDHVMPRAASG